MIKSPHLKFSNQLASVKEASEWLTKHAANESLECPVCHQLVKYYARGFDRERLMVLRGLFEFDTLVQPNGFMHVDRYMASKHEKNHRHYGDLQYWGLIESNATVKLADIPRLGYWRLTQTGRDFWLCKIKIPKMFWMYNRQVVFFSPIMWSIREAVVEAEGGFNYDKVMADVRAKQDLKSKDQNGKPVAKVRRGVKTKQPI
jgi:hypothetical protein